MRISNVLWKRLCRPKKKTVEDHWVDIIAKRPILFQECPKSLLTESFIKRVIKKNKKSIEYLSKEYISKSIVDYLIELCPSKKDYYLHLIL